MDNRVKEYIASIESPDRQSDVNHLTRIISHISGEEPKMWGSGIISFGIYHYKYESGREGDAPKIGISNRKQAIVIYGLNISGNDAPNYKLLTKLGKYKTGKGCLYIDKVSDLDMKVFENMLRNVSSRSVS